jgi:hypothetical protein
LGRCIFDSGISVLACSALDSKYAAAMDVFEVAIRKFVSSFGVLRESLIDAEIPFCIFSKAMLLNELVLELCRRPVFAPSAFWV